MPRKEVVASVIVIVAVVGAFTTVILLQLGVTTPGGMTTTTTTTPGGSVTEFKEFDEMYVYVDREGNASCQLTMQLPPSELANAMKAAVQQVGTSVYEQLCPESIKGSWAQFGLEAKNITCTVTGLATGENFRIAMAWEMPDIARREDNHWIISLDWVDNQSVAQDTIANRNSAWTIYRNISQNAYSNIYSKTIIVLPEGAENVCSPNINTSYVTDYGGGSYNEASFCTEQIGGRVAIIENSFSLFSTESEMTLTIGQLLENISSQTIDYDGAFPTDNWSFVSSIGRLRLDLKYGRELDEQYSIFIGQSEYSLSPAQLLYYTADAIDAINQGRQFSVGQPISVTTPSSEDGALETFWGSLSKTEYVSLAQQIRDNIESTGAAPGVITTSRGQIRFRDALLTFARILSAYRENGALPDEIILAPSPSGQLAWGTTLVPANYAYFLLRDIYVITGTTKVNEVLENVYQLGNDNRAYAEALCRWTHNNITYVLIVTPPTSEWVLENRRGQCRDYANVYLALLRTAEIPVKRVSGWIVLTGEWTPPAGLEPFMIGVTPDGRTIGSHAWNQVYLPDKGWTFADATWGYFENVPYDIYQQQEQTWMGGLAGYESAYGML
jgi:hypothetical protein